MELSNTIPYWRQSKAEPFSVYTEPCIQDYVQEEIITCITGCCQPLV